MDRMHTLQARWTAASATVPRRWRAKDNAMGGEGGGKEVKAAEQAEGQSKSSSQNRVRRLSRELVTGADFNVALEVGTFNVPLSAEAEEEKAVNAILAVLETRAVARVAMSLARAKGRDRLQRAMAHVRSV